MNLSVKDNLLLDEAVEKILENIPMLTKTEQVPLLDALDRVLAQDMYAAFSNPPFNRSAIDGYAVYASDTQSATKEQPVILNVITEVDAGDYYDKKVEPGNAVRIMTGAPIPDGCDACVRQEHTDYGSMQVQIYEPYSSYDNYCYKGEDFTKGQLILEKNKKLDYVDIGILASMGCETVPVYQRPVIGLFTTGDELIEPGHPLAPGKIYNSNLYTLLARLKTCGMSPKYFGSIPDEPEKAAALLSDLAAKCDLIITTGGVSVGKKDIIHNVIQLTNANRIFWGIKIKPGMPTIFSILNGCPMISLSGNPFGAVANMELLVRPAIAKLSNDTDFIPVTCQGVLMEDFNKYSGVRRFIRAIHKDGKIYLPKGSHSSGILTSLKQCNCMIDIPAGTKSLCAGETVAYIPLNDI